MGKRIRKERKANHMTQEALAEKAGISLSFLGHIERGSRKASIDTLVNIVNVLHISPNELLQDSLTWMPAENMPIASNQKDLLREIGRIIETNLDKWDQ